MNSLTDYYILMKNKRTLISYNINNLSSILKNESIAKSRTLVSYNQVRIRESAPLYIMGEFDPVLHQPRKTTCYNHFKICTDVPITTIICECEQ